MVQKVVESGVAISRVNKGGNAADHNPPLDKAEITQALEGFVALNRKALLANQTLFSNLWYDKQSTAGILESCGLGNELPHIRHAIKLLSGRLFLAADGNTVAYGGYKPEYDAFAGHAAAHGLISADASKRVLFINDIFDINSVLKQVSNAIPHTILQPYGAKREFLDLAKEHGLAVAVDETTCAIATSYGDKTQLRNLVHKIQASLNIPKQPRFALEQRLPDSAKLTLTEKEGSAHVIEEALAYHHKFWKPVERQTGEAKPFLFAQEARSGGGFGNHKIFLSDNGFKVSDRHFADREALYSFFEELRILGNLELAPFLDCRGKGLNRRKTDVPFLDAHRDSFSYGAVTSPNLSGFFGPREQVLKANLSDYRGFIVSIDSDTSDRMAIAITCSLTREMREAGYQGSFGIDFMSYIDRDGKYQLGVAEINARMDATCPLTHFIIRHPILCQKLVQGKLSFMQDDYFEVPTEILTRTGGDSLTKSFVEVLKMQGVPFVNLHPENTVTEGIVLVSPVAKQLEEDHSRCLLGIVADSNQKRDELYAMVYRAFYPG